MTFHSGEAPEKENGDWLKLDIPSDIYHNVEIQIEAEHARHMFDLKSRLRKAKIRSDELRRTEIESRLHNFQLLGMR